VIEPRDVAFEVSNLMLEIGAKLDASVLLVEERCIPAELDAYRKAVGQLMGAMLTGVMNPLYARHPDLKSAALK
jgi:Zn-dependent membrane protease YugP